ncbi:hypothetical protein ACTXM3_08525 [Glutamicibacter arilaitensis]|uniref:hypothetical protein n=1 Tax=Glutamicibacter arilaitensis TaxID=256701 RepID=UPI003FD45EEB
MIRKRAVKALANDRGEFNPSSVAIGSIVGTIVILGSMSVPLVVIPQFQDRTASENVASVARAQHGALSATSGYQSSGDLEKYRWITTMPENVATRVGQGGSCFTVIGKSKTDNLWVMEQDDEKPREAPGRWASDCLSSSEFEDLASSVGGTINATGALGKPTVRQAGTKVRWGAVEGATTYEVIVANENGRTVETVASTVADISGADLPGARISVTAKNPNQTGQTTSITVAP